VNPVRLGLNLLFLVPGATGGRETYARELIAAMVSLEPGLRLTAYVNSAAEPTLRRELGHNVDVRRVPVRIERPEQWVAGELGLLPAIARRDGIELLHSLANFGPASGPFVRVQTLHDLQYRAVPELVPVARRVVTGVMLRLAARRAQRIITGSEATLEEIVAVLRVPRDRLEVIHHGVRVRSQTVGQGPEMRHRLGCGERPVVLTVATNLPHKNLRAVIEALALIDAGTRPLVAMAGLGTDDGQLLALARSLGVQEDVRLLGRCSAEEVEALYALAACVVQPSLYEGFGLPAAEAMARGVPLACADIPTLREVTAGAALTFDPLRPGELADAVGRLIRDSELRVRLAAAGRERAKAFNWTEAGRATLSCYARALSAAAPARPGGRSPSRGIRASR
jgi:glycosyltransferase involved in cell wall biosynthesis